MNTLDKVSAFFQKKYFILGVWIVLAIFSASKQYAKNSYNNYLIFKNVYYHSLSQENLYAEYPDLYHDSNHYGPVFSLVIAPFAILPLWFGLSFWNIANAVVLFFAIWSLPIREGQKAMITWLVTNELFTSFVNFQFNPIIAATIIFAFSFIKKEKDIWAAFVIAIGTFVKLYSVAGLAFFFFSKHKLRLIAAGIAWSVLLFFVPMILTQPQFIVLSYQDWFSAIISKNSLNASLDSAQDISVMGLVRRGVGDANIPSLAFVVPGILLFLVPYLKFKEFAQEKFRQLILCSTLIFVVIFSSSSESSTYIIAFTGVSIWFALQRRPFSITVVSLFLFAFILTSLSPTIFPQVWREFVERYSLKALPCVIIWIYILYQLVSSKSGELKSELNS